MDIFLSSNDQTDCLKRIWTLCCQCAATVYGSTPPTAVYALRTARLLFMTGAQETGFQWERQRSPRFEGNVGGFGKWQVEPGSIASSLDYLHKRPDVLARATQWLFNDPHAPNNWPDLINMDAILWALRMDDNDKLALLFCRLHYLRVAMPIPDGEEQQAGYYKVYYNTILGAATVPGTLGCYQRFSALLNPAIQRKDTTSC